MAGVTAISRILVATDLSTRSDRALRRATLIAKRLEASLSVVHVVDIDQPHRMIEAQRAEAMQVLSETVRTSCETDGVPADFHIAIDDPFRGILSAADASEADLLILGPHRPRFRDVFTGTTVERVVRNSERPTLVAVQPPSAVYDRTLLAVDFDDASRTAASGALRMGIFDHMAVTVMHAFEAPAAGMMKRSMLPSESVVDYVAHERAAAATMLQRFSEELELPMTPRSVVLMEGSPARSILDSARVHKSDLVVLGTSKKSGAMRLLIGSVAEQVLRDAERDILIIPAETSDDSAVSAKPEDR